MTPISKRITTILLLINCLRQVSTQNCYAQSICDTGYIQIEGHNRWACESNSMGGQHCICEFGGLCANSYSMGSVNWDDSPEQRTLITMYLTQKIENITATIKWKDQGWGNKKGRIMMEIQSYNESSNIPQTCSQSIFGAAPHEFTTQSTSQNNCIDTKRYKDNYLRLYATIGGGGGHELKIDSFTFNISVYESQLVNVICNDHAITSPLLLQCQRGKRVLCGLDNSKSCHDMIIKADDQIDVELYCGGNSCTNVSIHGKHANTIDIKCKGNTACSKITVNGSYVKRMKIKAENYGALMHSVFHAKSVAEFDLICSEFNNQIDAMVCDNLLIDAKNAKNLNVFCNEHGCNELVVKASQVADINIQAAGDDALVSSIIYGQNAGKLYVLCGGVAQRTCVNTKIYLSSMPGSIRLYCSDNNDEWLMSNDANSMIVYTTKNERHIIDNYNVQKYSCSLHSVLENSTIKSFSLVVCILFLLGLAALVVLVIVVYKNDVSRWFLRYTRCSNKYISKKPLFIMSTLIYSIYVDIVILIAILWWGIKITMLYYKIKSYCSQKYNDNKQFCDADQFCKYYGRKYLCEPVLGIWVMIFVWWIVFGLVFMYEIAISNCCKEHRKNHYYYCTGEFITCTPNGRYLEKREMLLERYRKRRLWMDNTLNSFFVYIIMQLIYYGGLVILAWIVEELYDDNDYTIKWYEFYPLIILIISKIALITVYSWRKEYRPGRDIQQILKQLFGDDVGYKITEYLPEFYLSSFCSEEILLTNRNSNYEEMELLTEDKFIYSG